MSWSTRHQANTRAISSGTPRRVRPARYRVARGVFVQYCRCGRCSQEALLPRVSYVSIACAIATASAPGSFESRSSRARPFAAPGNAANSATRLWSRPEHQPRAALPKTSPFERVSSASLIMLSRNCRKIAPRPFACGHEAYPIDDIASCWVFPRATVKSNFLCRRQVSG